MPQSEIDVCYTNKEIERKTKWIERMKYVKRDNERLGERKSDKERTVQL